MEASMKAPVETAKALVHCPICSHTVKANIEMVAKRTKVIPGQKCERCHSSLDAAAFLYLAFAA
jgi:hypothetical protein